MIEIAENRGFTCAVCDEYVEAPTEEELALDTCWECLYRRPTNGRYGKAVVIDFDQSGVAD